jgi:outer membrane protein TolC
MKKGSFKGVILLAASVFLWHVPIGACASLSLDDAVDMALEQNTSIKITQKGEDTAKANLDAAKGKNGFSVSAETSFSKSDVDEKGRTDSNSNSISASLPIYTGGKNEANIDSYDDALHIAKLTTLRKNEDTKLSVIKAYYDILEAQKTIAVDQESVDNYQAHLTNVEQLYSAGSKAKVEVLRSSVELSNARQTLIKAQNTYDIDVSTLKNLIRMNPDEPLTLTNDFYYAAFEQDMQSCLDYAMQNRKDLQADLLDIDKSEKLVKAAKAGYLPTVSLSLSASWDKQLAPTHDNHDYTAGVSADWNIFDSSVTKATVSAAETAVDVARLTLENDQETVNLDVRTAYLNMKEAEKRFVSTQDAIKKAEEDYYIASEKYRAGEGLMLDIIDAQLALSTAKLNYISAQYDYARYKATVENTMGIDAVKQ